MGGAGGPPQPQQQQQQPQLFSQPQLQQLRMQIMAYRMLARNQAISPQLAMGVQGKRMDNMGGPGMVPGGPGMVPGGPGMVPPMQPSPGGQSSPGMLLYHLTPPPFF